MIPQIITVAFTIVVFILTVFKLVKENNTNYVYILILEFIGILAAFVSIVRSQQISIGVYVFIYALAIVLPLIIFVLQRKNLYFDEVIGFAKIRMHPESQKEVLLKMIDKHPKHYVLHRMLGEYYENRKEYEKAEDEYIETVRLNGKDVTTYCKLGRLLYKDNKVQESIQIMKALLSYKPDSYEGSMILGNIYYSTGAYKEALVVYSDILKHRPQEYQIYYRLGMTHTMLNDFNSALEFYRKAATLNSIDNVAGLNAGQIYLILKDYDQAAEYFCNTIKSDDEIVSAYSYYYLARIRMIQNNQVQAVLYANTAIETYPSISEKIEKDMVLMPILGKINLENKEKKVKTELSKKQIDIVEYLSNTYSKVESLSNNLKTTRDMEQERY